MAKNLLKKADKDDNDSFVIKPVFRIEEEKAYGLAVIYEVVR